VAVVVNEFEVVPEATAVGKEGAPERGPERPSPPLANEIERTLRVLRDRARRLSAD
jgi:hypothetical protein